MKPLWFKKLETVAQPEAKFMLPADKLIAALCQAVDAYRREVAHVRKQYTPAQVTYALEMVDNGMALRKAAKAAGVTFHAVWSARQRRDAALQPTASSRRR